MEQTVTMMISTLGFPICCAIALAWFCYKSYNKMTDTLDKITQTNQELVMTNSSLIKTMDLKIDNIQTEVNKLAESK